MTKSIDRTQPFFKILYGSFVLLAIYFLVKQDYFTAASNLGIALIFDPFDQKKTWSQRPFYQKAWLLVHAALVTALFVIGIFA